MKLASILLGSAAGLMVASAASAADLPGEAVPTAVDYVKVCDAFGTGFFYIPGTENCLRFDGRVRFRVATGRAYTDDDVVQLRTDARFGVDVRTATELGTLRTYVRVDAGGTGNAYFDRAFIQLSYLTVGLAGNFFDDFGGIYGINDRNWGGDSFTQATLRFTDLGGGFYAGIQAHATAPIALRETYDGDVDSADGNANYPIFEAIAGIDSQPWGSAAAALMYAPDIDNTGRDVLAVKGAVTFAITDGVEITARAWYLDDVVYERNNVTFTGEEINLGLGVQVAATESLNIYANGEYAFVDLDGGPDADRWGATLGAAYTIVSGLTAEAELSYDDGENIDDSVGGIVRLVREW